MSEFIPQVQKTWDHLEELGLISISDKAQEKQEMAIFVQSIAASIGEVEELLKLCEDSEYVQNLSLEELLKLPYNSAKNLIDTFSMPKRIDMLNTLTIRRDHYYNEVSRFGAEEDGITNNEFKQIMSKIKHLEIVQNWLYGIQ